MANQEHLDLLKRGVEQWNEWRRQNSEILPDLSGADLRRIDLYGIDLRYADLVGANLDDTNLFHASLFNAKLSNASLFNAMLQHANLSVAILQQANLSEADLSSADMSGANLSTANLSSANLSHVNLNSAWLISADLRGAIVSQTVFANVDLRTTRGLTEIRFSGKSPVELQTVQLPSDSSALYFLQGTGVPDEWIDFWRATMMHPVQYHSLFISYCSQDDTLAHRLRADLQDHGVRCWFAPEDMKIGDKIRQRIDEAIHLQDKLLLLLSKHSIASNWVENEVEAAIEKEQRHKREVLFPVRLDDAVMQTTQAWAAKLRRSTNIGDFTNWTNPQAYQQAFERLLRDLKKESDTKGETYGQPRAS